MLIYSTSALKFGGRALQRSLVRMCFRPRAVLTIENLCRPQFIFVVFGVVFSSSGRISYLFF